MRTQRHRTRHLACLLAGVLLGCPADDRPARDELDEADLCNDSQRYVLRGPLQVPNDWFALVASCDDSSCATVKGEYVCPAGCSCVFALCTSTSPIVGLEGGHPYECLGADCSDYGDEWLNQPEALGSIRPRDLSWEAGGACGPFEFGFDPGYGEDG